MRCHEAYIVNLDFVRVVRKDEVELAGGENIPVGISFEKTLRTKYMEYWSERI